MKKLLFTFLSLTLLIGSGFSQDGKKLFKQAEKSMGKCIKKPTEEQASFQEAVTAFDQAFQDEKIASEAKNWNKKGDLFNDLADSQIKFRLLNPAFPLTDPNAALTAFEAYNKALEVATKNGDMKNAYKGFESLESNLSNIGVELYREKKYEGAFANFDASLKVKNMLNENDMKSRLDDPTLYNDQIFFTAVSAHFANLTDESIPYLKIILEQDGISENKPFAYEAIYKNLTIKGEKEMALKYLMEGREAYPDDTGLLFAEINYYLESGQNEVLIDKLKIAIEKEPDNLSVMNTLGNVYDQMSQTARAEGNIELADQYFNDAMTYYNIVISKKPDEFLATYSIGALYYNKAAAMTTNINDLANDFSAEGTKKYTLLKGEMDGYFSEALPYFLKAETLNTEDLNTLIALREIYARKNDFEKVNEYKIKFEAASAKQEKN